MIHCAAVCDEAEESVIDHAEVIRTSELFFHCSYRLSHTGSSNGWSIRANTLTVRHAELPPSDPVKPWPKLNQPESETGHRERQERDRTESGQRHDGMRERTDRDQTERSRIAVMRRQSSGALVQ